MELKSKNRLAACAAITALMTLSISGCSIVKPRALEPIDWIDKNIERYAVTGKGSWARLRKQPLLIGDYAATPEDQPFWQSVPTDTSSDTQLSWGSDDGRGRQLHSGTVTQHRESDLNFQLSGPAHEMADIRCRELLYTETEESGLRRGDGSDSFTLSEMLEYRASLSCRARSLSEAWPVWQIDLNSSEPAPLNGTLKIDNTFFDIVGTQSSTIGQLPQTVSYEIRRGDQVLALIDRSGDGLLSMLVPVGEKQQHAFLGAAAALLLANDPLEP